MALLRPVDGLAQKARLFRTLGDEPRLAVAEELNGGERRVSDLAQYLHLSQSSVSTHLAALHAAGLAARRADGRSAFYRFVDPSVGALLQAADDVVVAIAQQAYTCSQACCQPVVSAQ